jgi:N6-adenosine-specific RNA methylase IME4
LPAESTLPQVHDILIADIEIGTRHRKDMGDLKELARSIDKHGLLHPVVITEDNILISGQRRLLACQDNLDRTHILARVIDVSSIVEGEHAENHFRKDFNFSERFDIAEVIKAQTKSQQGKRTELTSAPGGGSERRNVIAEQAGFASKNEHARVKEVVERGAPELVVAMDSGKIDVTTAAKIAGKPKKAQKRIVAADNPKAELKKLQRNAREKELAEKTVRASEELGKKQYGVIYADPAWRYEPYSRETGMDRSADNHYPTMTDDEIAAFAASSSAAEDSVLFLWATAPMLTVALDVMSKWGFTYKTHIIWNKDKDGTGYWARNRHELLLIGTRGDVPAPAPGDQPSSVIEAPRGKHSEKPAKFRELIEQMFPNLSRVELFARTKPEGWDAWGNEVPDDPPQTTEVQDG